MTVMTAVQQQRNGKPARVGSLIFLAVAICLAMPLSHAGTSLLTTQTQHAAMQEGHLLHLLENGDDSLLARIHLIRAATQSIDIQTFIWSDDESGRFVFTELVQAARRGVRVRILIDDLTECEPARRFKDSGTFHVTEQSVEFRHDLDRTEAVPTVSKISWRRVLRRIVWAV